jgi:hypothetical protein
MMTGMQPNCTYRAKWVVAKLAERPRAFSMDDLFD